jgi:hypothetical protein
MITLTPEQQRWLEAEVAAGRLPSIEHAVRMAVADFKITNTGALRWPKPHRDRMVGWALFVLLGIPGILIVLFCVAWFWMMVARMFGVL